LLAFCTLEITALNFNEAEKIATVESVMQEEILTEHSARSIITGKTGLAHAGTTESISLIFITVVFSRLQYIGRGVDGKRGQ
jgi:hypothetical protein